MTQTKLFQHGDKVRRKQAVLARMVYPKDRIGTITSKRISAGSVLYVLWDGLKTADQVRADELEVVE